MNRKPLLLIASAVAVLAACMLPGNDGRQEWRLSRYTGDAVRISLDRWKPGHHTRVSIDVPVDRFRGLSPALFNRGGSARFEYVQDAGRLVCEGRFSFGSGSGSFTFLPDPDFTADLQRLGYDAPTEHQFFDMLLMGVTIDDALAARDAGLRAGIRELLDLRTHGVNAEFIRETRAAGARDFDARDLVQLKMQGVPPTFLRDLKAAGYDLPADKVVELKMHGVSSDFLRDLDAYGLQPPASDLVQLRMHGVTADFMRDAKTLGHQFTAQELVQLRMHGVDGRYLRRLHDSGMRNLTAAQIQRLKIHGVD